MSPTSLGFHYKVELSWLDSAAAVSSTNVDSDSFREQLDSMLQRDPNVELTARGRSKAIGVLARIWHDVESPATPARQSALSLLPSVLPEERIAIHWAMAVAAFPFFHDVAATTGRLINLQGEAGIASIKRRIAEEWGERSTVQRAVGIVLGTIRDWGAIDGTLRVVHPAAPLSLPPSVSALLVECVLLADRHASLSLSDATSPPALFPFDLDVDAQGLRDRPTLRVDRFGGGEDVVALAGL